MPDFWEFPTVSMGLGPIMAIYQARFNRYLENRGLKKPSDAKVWAFLGDGETDEPETLGAITLAAREKLDNLIFVINCNLQRLDGPVRGNGQIIQELEAIFRGAGWNVIKVIWGCDWDALFAARQRRPARQAAWAKWSTESIQKYAVESGAYFRKHFFGTDPRLLEMVKHLSDDQLKRLRLGGHDPVKVYNAYRLAVETKGQPTVVLARTIKGYGLGEAGEGKNITHQQKKMNESGPAHLPHPVRHSDLRRADRRGAVLSAGRGQPRDGIHARAPQGARRMGSARKRRASSRSRPRSSDVFEEFYKGTEGRKASTTMVFVRMLSKLLRDKEIGKLVVPIVPDEARTFGMEALFRAVGIYSHVGQLYEPVDMDTLLYYKEAKDGQILEEGITEAGSMSSFIAAGTAYATHGVNTIPFFIYYSMFGFQRVGDLIWAAADSRVPRIPPRRHRRPHHAGGRGAAAPGRQQSRVFAVAYPNCVSYDPAYAYELAVIIQDGIRRMYHDGESIFYYLTVMNEQYAMPEMPEDSREGILKGMYRLKAAADPKSKLRAQLFGSGAILNEVVAAQEILAKYGVAADVWSVTSYQELYREGHACERWNMLHPGEKPRVPYVTQCLADAPGVFVAVSDYLKVLPDAIDRWMPRRIRSLGTDGFGRSEDRQALRNFFEVNAKFVVIGTLAELLKDGQVDAKVVQKAIKDLGVDVDKKDPAKS